MRALRARIGSRETRIRVLGAATGAALILGGLGVYGLTRSSGTARARPPHAEAPLLSKAAFEQRSGVRIIAVAVTGDGGLVDIRYEVIDPNAAASIHSQATPPQLVDERTGVLVNRLLMGHIHNGQMKAAQTYFLLFENPGNLVRAGGRVTVQLGSARVAHVPVR
jgi:hypothetical protein